MTGTEPMVASTLNSPYVTLRAYVWISSSLAPGLLYSTYECCGQAGRQEEKHTRQAGRPSSTAGPVSTARRHG